MKSLRSPLLKVQIRSRIYPSRGRALPFMTETLLVFEERGHTLYPALWEVIYEGPENTSPLSDLAVGQGV